MVKWCDEGKNSLWLFKIEEFNKIPNGTIFECISGNFVTKGVDEIDLDTRFGHIAFGIRNVFTHPEHELFLTFMLS